MCATFSPLRPATAHNTPHAARGHGQRDGPSSLPRFSSSTPGRARYWIKSVAQSCLVVMALYTCLLTVATSLCCRRPRPFLVLRNLRGCETQFSCLVRSFGSASMFCSFSCFLRLSFDSHMHSCRQACHKCLCCHVNLACSESPLCRILIIWSCCAIHATPRCCLGKFVSYDPSALRESRPYGAHRTPPASDFARSKEPAGCARFNLRGCGHR